MNGGNIMGEFANKLYSFIDSADGVIIALVAIALLVAGVMMIYPSERSKEAAKTAVPWIVIGAAVALGATAIAQSITSGW